MVAGSEHGCSQTIVSRITALAMARPCVCHHVPGSWIAVSVPERECGRQTAEP